MSDFYKNKRVCIAGGAGFIGSHLHDALLTAGAKVMIADNLSSGSIENVERVWKKHRQTNTRAFILADFQDFAQAKNALKGAEIVFHLAAHFGGRGYIDTHPADCCENFAIDANVIKAAYQNGAERVQFASTACVYPLDLQKTYASTYALKEDDAFHNGWGNADREYGWAKLMGELTLQAFHAQYGLKGVITRYVTACGPYQNDTHALIALIRRAVERQDPYVVWGSGDQDRDFTYIDDIVQGTLLACEHIMDARAVNIGTSKRYTIKETIAMIFDAVGWHPKKIIFDTTKPEGVKTRALDTHLCQQLLHWKPTITLRQGIVETVRWFARERPSSVETLV